MLNNDIDKVIDKVIEISNEFHGLNWDWRIQDQDMVSFSLDQVRAMILMSNNNGTKDTLHSIMDGYRDWSCHGDMIFGGKNFQQFLDEYYESVYGEKP